MHFLVFLAIFGAVKPLFKVYRANFIGFYHHFFRAANKRDMTCTLDTGQGWAGRLGPLFHLGCLTSSFTQ